MSTDVTTSINVIPVDPKATAVVTTAEIIEDAPQSKDRLKAGESLTQNQSITSPNGKYTFVVQGDGNVCIYEVGGRCIWASNTTRRWDNVVKVLMQDNGDLVIKGRDDNTAFSSSTGGKGNATSVLIIQNDGNAVIESDGKQIWQTKTGQRTLPKKDFADGNRCELYVGDVMRENERLTSANGEYYFLLQDDHNLALHKKDGTQLWAQGYDAGCPGEKWGLQADGNIAIMLWDDEISWSTQTAGKGNTNSCVRIQDDGNVVLITDGQTVWKTNTGDKPSDRLESNEALGLGGKLASPNGKYTLILQQDRNLVLYEGDNPIWATGTETWIDLELRMYGGGNLVLGSFNGSMDWESGSGPGRSEEDERSGRNDTEGDATLFVQDDGMVAIKKNSVTIWTNRSELGYSLAGGSSIGPVQWLSSPGRRFQFKYQPDGNFVLYDNFQKPARAVWATNTENTVPGKVALQNSGNLVVYDAQDNVQWSSDTGRYAGRGDIRLDVQNDGNAVIKVEGEPVWATEMDRFRRRR